MPRIVLFVSSVSDINKPRNPFITTIIKVVGTLLKWWKKTFMKRLNWFTEVQKSRFSKWFVSNWVVYASVSIRLNARGFVQSRLIYFVCILPIVSLQMCYQTGHWLFYFTLTQFRFQLRRSLVKKTRGLDNMTLYSAVVAKGAPASTDPRE